MIGDFVKVWEANKADVRAKFAAAHPENYKAIVEAVVQMLHDNVDAYSKPDPTRIHEIDDGDYQGTLVYVIAATGYQPDDYWYVRVSYGSCSGCDTLESIRGYSDDPPTPEQAGEYTTLALHIVQQLKKMDGEAA